MILVDTNFALRLIEPSHQHHIAAIYTSEFIRRKGDERLVSDVLSMIMPTIGDAIGVGIS